MQTEIVNTAARTWIGIAAALMLASCSEKDLVSTVTVTIDNEAKAADAALTVANRIGPAMTGEWVSKPVEILNESGKATEQEIIWPTDRRVVWPWKRPQSTPTIAGWDTYTAHDDRGTEWSGMLCREDAPASAERGEKKTCVLKVARKSSVLIVPKVKFSATQPYRFEWTGCELNRDVWLPWACSMQFDQEDSKLSVVIKKATW